MWPHIIIMENVYIYVTVPSPQTQRENVLYSVTPIKGEIISKFSK